MQVPNSQSLACHVAHVVSAHLPCCGFHDPANPRRRRDAYTRCSAAAALYCTAAALYAQPVQPLPPSHLPPQDGWPFPGWCFGAEELVALTRNVAAHFLHLCAVVSVEDEMGPYSPSRFMPNRLPTLPTAKAGGAGHLRKRVDPGYLIT